jgi:ankyrin repeat protein
MILDFRVFCFVLQDGFTPLLLALKENKIEMAKFLVKMGANIHVFDDMRRYYHLNFLFFYFLLAIFFICISNANLKVPYTLPLPCSPTHPLQHLSPGIPLYWGI